MRMKEDQMNTSVRRLSAARTAIGVCGVVMAALLGSAATAHAEVDDHNRIVSDGNDITVMQEDTFIHGVPALGGSPLNREWFHNGRASATIVGPGADQFKASTFEVGYQVAWTASLDGSIAVSWTSPTAGLGMGQGIKDGAALSDGFVNGNIQVLPTATASLALTPAPGVAEISLVQGTFDGAVKSVQLANVHGTASNVVGSVQLRPFVRLTTANGDQVTTYGEVATV